MPVSVALLYMDSVSPASDCLSELSDISPAYTFRTPQASDGNAVFELVSRCQPLDENSLYCNLLQCSHFSDTSIVAEAEGQMVGFISGYRLPQQPNTLFVWQVAVDASQRGKGLASQMLENLVKRVADVAYLHTTITPDNKASWNTFKRFALNLKAPLSHNVLFDKHQHFAGKHDSEELVVIGPFTRF